VWDAHDYEIKALVKKDEKIIQELPLSFTGNPSLFAGTFKTEGKGSYELIVYAYNPANGNTGIDRTSFTIK
jgi:hypothetical protein